MPRFAWSPLLPLPLRGFLYWEKKVLGSSLRVPFSLLLALVPVPDLSWPVPFILRHDPLLLACAALPQAQHDRTPLSPFGGTPPYSYRLCPTAFRPDPSGAVVRVVCSPAVWPQALSVGLLAGTSSLRPSAWDLCCRGCRSRGAFAKVTSPEAVRTRIGNPRGESARATNPG